MSKLAQEVQTSVVFLSPVEKNNVKSRMVQEHSYYTEGRALN